jgi:hypothetical protein
MARRKPAAPLPARGTVTLRDRPGDLPPLALTTAPRTAAEAVDAASKYAATYPPAAALGPSSGAPTGRSWQPILTLVRPTHSSEFLRCDFGYVATKAFRRVQRVVRRPGPFPLGY